MEWMKYQMTEIMCLEKVAGQAGLRPVPMLWLDQPPVGDVQNRTVKNDVPVCARSLLNLTCNSSSLANAGRTARWNLALRPAETNNTRVNQRLCKRRNVAEPAA